MKIQIIEEVQAPLTVSNVPMGYVFEDMNGIHYVRIDPNSGHWNHSATALNYNKMTDKVIYYVLCLNPNSPYPTFGGFASDRPIKRIVGKFLITK